MGTDTKAVLAAAAISLMLIGAKTVVKGVGVGAKNTGHVIVRVFKHPVHSIKDGAIHKAPSE